MPPPRGPQPDLLILTFPKGSSLSRWDRFGVIDRERPFIEGLAAAIPRILFISADGEHDARIARQLNTRCERALPKLSAATRTPRIDAIAEHVPDEDLCASRTLVERVLTRVGDAGDIVIQTMQLDDGGIANRLLNPLRRIGRNAALVARGSFIDSRVLSSSIGPHHYKTRSLGAAEQQICSAAQMVVGTSETMIEELCWKNGISPERARVVPQHVAENPHAAPDEKGRPPPRAKDLIVTAGRYDGDPAPFRAAIDAVSALPPARRDTVRLEILGSGKGGEGLAAHASQAGVNTTLRRGLTHDQLQSTLASATVYLQTEGCRRQSHTVLEAMAAGCPVVVTDLAEYNGLIENGTTGIRVAPDSRGFAFAIDCLLADAAFRSMLGEAGQGKIALKCGLDRALPATLDCYADALRAAPQRGNTGEKRAS